MDKNDIKEKGRYVAIKEKAKTLKEKPAKRLPSVRYRIARETYRKKKTGEEQRTAPEQVEYAARNTAHFAIQNRPRNVFHRETHFEPEPQPSSPKDLMRHKFIRERMDEKKEGTYREQHTDERKQKPGIRTRQSVERKQNNEAGQQRELPHFSYMQAEPYQTSKNAVAREQGRRLAQNKAARQIKTGSAKASDDVFRRMGSSLTKVVTPSRDDAMIYGGLIIMIIIPLIMLAGIAVALFTPNERSSYVPVSAEVEAYTPIIQHYAAEYGIPEYTELIKAVMMQESGGLGTDPMQASECAYNTRYPHGPNSITDPEYSIRVGIQNLLACLQLAGVESPIDIDNISLALQGYNFGSGYISWARENYGGYSEMNAIEFSEMMAARMGWPNYGDKAYVSHVLRYYPLGRSFMADGNPAIVAVAKTQIGNRGGLKYCEWYGYPYRVEWCAIFVSWCADQCGYIDTGVIPKFAYCPEGANWFMANGQWQDRYYEPLPGDIIFFDWERDGVCDHVGIVESCEDGFVFIINGNDGDTCIETRYYAGSNSIYGYGMPAY